jgi:hypothetical protein
MIQERILVMGSPGTGKSWNWLKMAEELPHSRFRCLDTDNAIPYMLETQFPHLKAENGGNVEVYPAFDFPEYREGLGWVLDRATDIDWTIVDMADNAWSSVQRYFVTEVFQENMGDYFLEARKKLREVEKTPKSMKTPKSIMPEVLRGWLDWPVVNKLYDDWILPLIFRLRGHLYVATKIQALSSEDDQVTRELFGIFGVRPSGQKHLGHQMHSIFLFNKGSDGWYITTVKDRANRPYFERVRLESFYYQYLVAKAGWK